MAVIEQQLAAPLIQTKLEVPAPRALVSRERLLARLASEPYRRLTLIKAPAGWGKTTLLAEWSAYELDERPLVWLSLEPADNDPTRFWLYVIEALRAVAGDLGEASLAILRVPGVDLTTEVLPPLINEVAESERELVLALDDYHMIVNNEIHAGMAFLIDHLPDTLRLVLASRSEPPLPVARLRARGELMEIGTDGLRFSAAETEVFVNSVHALGLAKADVARLRDRTEGWAAGLYLAVLSLDECDDRRAFIDSFAGDDRDVVDYLGAEVLAGLPDDVRTFMLCTSIADTFSAGLCAAITRTEDASEMLDRIERSNFFLVALDRTRNWYRYHHLFRELLRHKLRLTESAEQIAELHRRAANWLRETGLVYESIHHLLNAGDLTEASELIAAHWLGMLNAGRRTTVKSLLDALPQDVILDDSRLCIARGWTSFALAQLDDVLSWADLAERAPNYATQDGRVSDFAGAVTSLRASYWMLRGDIRKSEDLARQAIAITDQLPWRAAAFNWLGTSAFWYEEPKEASTSFEEAVRIGRSVTPLFAIYATGRRALIAADDNDWDEVRRRVNDASKLVAGCGAQEHWVTSVTHHARSRLLERDGRPDESLDELERALTLARRGGAYPLGLAYALLSLANACRARGDLGRACQLVAEAQEHVSPLRDPGTLLPRLLAQAELQHERAAPATSAGSAELSVREAAILRLLPSELSQREIAEMLYVSRNTVKTHMRGIFRKLDASTREDVVARARERGLL